MNRSLEELEATLNISEPIEEIRCANINTCQVQAMRQRFSFAVYLSCDHEYYIFECSPLATYSKN